MPIDYVTAALDKLKKGKAYRGDAGVANWQAEWSLGKKASCCQHVGMGCAATPCPSRKQLPNFDTVR